QSAHVILTPSISKTLQWDGLRVEHRINPALSDCVVRSSEPESYKVIQPLFTSSFHDPSGPSTGKIHQTQPATQCPDDSPVSRRKHISPCCPSTMSDLTNTASYPLAGESLYIGPMYVTMASLTWEPLRTRTFCPTLYGLSIGSFHSPRLAAGTFVFQLIP